MSATAPGLCPVTRHDVVVVEGQAMRVDFSLSLGGVFFPMVVKEP